MIDLARDFKRNRQILHKKYDYPVFKALLRADPVNPIPADLYHRLPGGNLAYDPAHLETAIDAQKEAIIREYQICSAMQQTHRVMQVYELVQIGNEFGVLFEKISGESLGDLAKKSHRAIELGLISPEDHLDLTRQAISDVLVAVARCADEGIVHADISPNNVMYDREKKIFKLIDLGNSREAGQVRPNGTPGFTDITTSIADEKGDIYSVGQLFVSLLKDPEATNGFSGFSPASLTVERFPFMEDLQPLPQEDKKQILAVIRRMVQIPAQTRASAAELLRDPLFANLVSRDQVHESYETMDRRSKIEILSARFNKCYTSIQSASHRDLLYKLMSDLNEALAADDDENVKRIFDQLNTPSIHNILTAAEARLAGPVRRD